MPSPSASITIDVSSSSEQQLADEMERLRAVMTRTANDARNGQRSGGIGTFQAFGVAGSFLGNDMTRAVSIVASLVAGFREAGKRAAEYKEQMLKVEEARINALKVEREIVKKQHMEAIENLRQRVVRRQGAIVDAMNSTGPFRQDRIDSATNAMLVAREQLRSREDELAAHNAQGDPAANPVKGMGRLGVAISGLASAAPAVAAGFSLVADVSKKLYQHFDHVASSLEQYNAQLANTRANQDISGMLSEMRRADKLGPDLVRFTESQTRIAESFSSISTTVEAALLKASEPFMDRFEELLESVDENAGKIAELIAVFGKGATTGIDAVAALIAGAIEGVNPAEVFKMMKQMQQERRDRRRRKENRGFDQFMQDLLEMKPPGGAREREVIVRPGAGGVII